MIWALDERDRSEFSSPHPSQMMPFGDLAAVWILESVAKIVDPTKHLIHDDLLGTVATTPFGKSKWVSKWGRKEGRKHVG